MSTNHTQEPWHVADNRDSDGTIDIHTWDGSTGVLIAEVAQGELIGEQALPNAHLLAAAPDLLRELKKGRALALREVAARAPGELGEPYLRELVASMDAAIKKATPL